MAVCQVHKRVSVSKITSAATGNSLVCRLNLHLLVLRVSLLQLEAEVSIKEVSAYETGQKEFYFYLSSIIIQKIRVD